MGWKSVLHGALLGAIPAGNVIGLLHLQGAITAASRRNLISIVMPSLKTLGWSGRDILGGLRKYGLGIRTQDFYGLQRGGLAINRNRAALRGLAPGDKPFVDPLTPSFGFGTQQHGATVDVAWYDPSTGAKGVYHSTVEWSGGMTAGQVEEAGQEAVPWGVEYKGKPAGAEFVSATIADMWTWKKSEFSGFDALVGV